MEEPELRQIFAHNIKRQLDISGMNQKELAKAVGVSPSMVSLWCMGKNVPRTGYLSRLTEVFQCKMTDLLLENKKSPPQSDGPTMPEGYQSLSPENRAIVDALILQLAKSQSGSPPTSDCALTTHNK